MGIGIGIAGMYRGRLSILDRDSVLKRVWGTGKGVREVLYSCICTINTFLICLMSVVLIDWP